MLQPVRWFYEVSDQLLGKLDVKFLHLQKILKWIPFLIHIHCVFNKKSSCSEPLVASGLYHYSCITKDCYFLIVFLWHIMMYIDQKFLLQKRLKKGPLFWQVFGSIRRKVDQADCFLLAFFVLKGHKSRQDADKRGTFV